MKFIGRFARQQLEQGFAACDAVPVRCSQPGGWVQYAPEIVAWRAAGGEFAAAEQVQMQSSWSGARRRARR